MDVFFAGRVIENPFAFIFFPFLGLIAAVSVVQTFILTGIFVKRLFQIDRLLAIESERKFCDSLRTQSEYCFD